MLTGYADRMTDHDAPPADPGWYPAPHANGESRYWDGTQWTDRKPDAVAADTVAADAVAADAVAADAAAVAPSSPTTRTGRRMWGVPPWGWVLIGIGVLIALSVVVVTSPWSP